MIKSSLFTVLLLIVVNIKAQVFSNSFDNPTSSPLLGSWTVPNNVTSVKVQCWGGGGGGGGATGQGAAGGGGSGGAYTEKTFSVSAGQVFNYSIGNGGISSYNNGGNGGNTWFSSSTTLLAKGGNGGLGANNTCCQTAFGASAVTSGNIGGTINFYGGAGGTGTYGGNGSEAGGGGGAAGSTGNGQPGAGRIGGLGGQFGGGDGASSGTWQLPLNCNCNGNIGGLPGGGGSGGQASGVLDRFSGAGGGGRITISYILPGIGGKIFSDQNQNCIDDSELGISNVRVLLKPGNLITETNSSGHYAFNFIPSGQYTVTIDTSLLNRNYCIENQMVDYTDPTTFLELNPFGIQTTVNCSSPNISIQPASMRRCFSNQIIHVEACNKNGSTADMMSAYADIILDPLFNVNSASLPYQLIGNSTYRFQLGNLNSGQCEHFTINTTVSCNANLGQTLCMEATLFPAESCALDTVPSNPPAGGGGGTGGTLDGLPQPCTLPWDQSSLSVDGWCQNDTIYFTITNTGDPGGGDMECYSPLWVTVDGVVTFTDSIMISGGQTITYSFPGDGATWILNAEQHPLHPGNSHPNAHVEACGDANNWTPGLVNELPLDDADPVVDIYCGVVTGSFDPNDKTGYPLGQTDEHFIQPNQQLQYVIRFQNTGTDTAFTVVIRDTLDTDLNIFTVTPGVSSHNYTFQMYGPRVLEWTFNNINLPDSTTDLEGSNGFVTFHVEQVPNLTPGTEITNDADIYFDFNDPIIPTQPYIAFSKDL